MVTPEERRREALAVDIDTRLSALWIELWEPGPLAEAMAADDVIRDLVASSLRYAYGRGYVDALKEDRAGQRAELHRTHGYKPE